MACGHGPKPRREIDYLWRGVKLLGVFCLVWIWVTTFAPTPIGLMRSDWTLCPRPTVCAESWLELALLGVSRSSAYFSYPLILLLFLSKARNLGTALQQSVAGLFIPFHRMHELHTAGGIFVGVDVVAHAACHVARWVVQGNARFLYASQTGATGVLMIVLTPLIVLPMALPALRARYKWEWRKGLHYLSVAWGVALACHAPAMQVAYLVGGALAVYALDYTWGLLARTHRIATSEFTRLEDGVELTFRNPPGFGLAGGAPGYVMLCVPWLYPSAKLEWHAFSLFPHPRRPGHSCVCVQRGGDWTRALHRAIERPTTRPVWVAGPYASPYSTADEFQNLVLVASGIGITPALSVLGTLRSSRRTNLVWMCRDASLLEFYVRSCLFPSDAWTLIYYTGRRRLVLDDAQLPRTVMIFRGRPNLDCVVRELIAGIELETGLPERMVAESDQQRRSARRLFDEFYSPRGGDGATTAAMSATTFSGNVFVPTDEAVGLSSDTRRCLADAEKRFHSALLSALRAFGPEKLRARAPRADAPPIVRNGDLGVCLDHLVPDLGLLHEDAAALLLQRGYGERGALLAKVDALIERMAVREANAEAAARSALGEDEDEETGAAPLTPAHSVPAGERRSTAWFGADIARKHSVQQEPARALTLARRSFSHPGTTNGGALDVPLLIDADETAPVAGAEGDQPEDEGSAPKLSVREARIAFSAVQNPEAAPCFYPRMDDDHDAESSRRFVEAVGGAAVLKRWGMLYCGGAQPVVDALTKIGYNYGIVFRAEKFDW